MHLNTQHEMSSQKPSIHLSWHPYSIIQGQQTYQGSNMALDKQTSMAS